MALFSGSDPDCGFVCCPPQGKSFVINEPPPDLSIHDIQYEEIEAFVREVMSNPFENNVLFIFLSDDLSFSV